MEKHMPDTFQTFIDQERVRLNKQREDILAKQQDLKDQLAANTVELQAITAYETVKKGKPSTKRGSDSKRERVLELLMNSANGLSRSQLLEALNLKGNKSGEQSISNALTNLKKQKRITASDDGAYRVA
jgi:Fe2+ or Zn2+ uptake regulation protein